MENKRIFSHPGYQRGQPEKSSSKPFSAFMAREAHIPAVFLSLNGSLPPGKYTGTQGAGIYQIFQDTFRVFLG